MPSLMACLAVEALMEMPPEVFRGITIPEISCQGRKQGAGQVDVFRIDAERGMLEKTCTMRFREIESPVCVIFKS